MNSLVEWHLDELPNGELCFHIQMKAPRSNALEPSLLAEIHCAFDALDQSGAKKALISGGRNFSSGGDVARFADMVQSGQTESYTKQVVPVLQALVLRMIEMPVVFASAIQGATTGGAAGLVFASDIAVAAPDAFVQPYYGKVGFAPDGGWTALLPDLIGVAHAQDWIVANRRLDSEQLQKLGLVTSVDPKPELRARALLGDININTALSTKSLLWGTSRRADLKSRLSAETVAFSDLIERPETLNKMQDFLQRIG